MSLKIYTTEAIDEELQILGHGHSARPPAKLTESGVTLHDREFNY